MHPSKTLQYFVSMLAFVLFPAAALQAGGILIVAHKMADSVGFYDAANGKLIATLPVGVKPHEMVFSSDGKRVYVTNDVGQKAPHNSGSGTITVLAIDGSGSNKQVNVGGIPMGLELSPDGKRLYAATRTNNSIAVIDTASNELVRKIEVPGHPVRLRIGPGGKHLIVTLIDSGEVAVIDTSSFKEVRRLPAGTHAEGIMIDAEKQELYVSIQGENKVRKYSLQDFRPLMEIPTAERPDPLLIYR